MAEYELFYFDFSARAGVSRMMFALSGVEYKDTKFSFPEWGAAKNDRTRFPMGYLPVLRVNKELLSESMAINDYLATELGFHGSNSLERARVSMVAHALQSLWEKWTKHMFEGDKELAAKLKEKFYNEQLPNVLVNLEEVLKQNNNGDGYFVGNKVTLADLFLVDIGHTILTFEKNSLDKYPKLKLLYERVAEKPALAKHLSARKLTPN